MNDKKIQMGDRKMDYKDMKAQLEQMATDNYKEFTKAFISFEKGIDDQSALDKLYENYRNNDSMMLLNDTFDEMIEELRENGELSQQVDSQQIEENNLVNLVGNIVGEVEVVERKTREGDLQLLIFQLHQRTMRETNSTLTVRLMEIKEKSPKILIKVILSRFLGKFVHLLTTKVRFIVMYEFLLLSS